MLPLIAITNAAQEDKKVRQQTLRYGVVMHAMIDMLDREHHVTKKLPAYPNKLNRNSKRELRFRTFGAHLKFVENIDKYIRQ